MDPDLTYATGQLPGAKHETNEKITPGWMRFFYSKLL